MTHPQESRHMMHGDKFRFNRDLQVGDEGASVYWRVLARLQDDPIASMFHERVLEGLSAAYMDGMVQGGRAEFTRTGAQVFARRVVTSSLLSLLGPEAQEHLAGVIESAIFIEAEV